MPRLITAGVDLSADPRKTASCVIDWVDRTVSFQHAGVGDVEIVELGRRADVVGIDVPLGWPIEFLAAVSAHQDGGPWPALPTPRLRFRRTDLALYAQGHRPLSVSSDLIGVVAFRGARLQTMLRESGLAVDRTGTTGHLVEVYPAAALKIWGLTATGYKGSNGASRRADLIVALEAVAGGLSQSLVGQLTGAADHAVDAFVCAVVAGAARVGLATSPEDVDLEAAQIEGWIHIPTRPLPDVIEAVLRAARNQ